MNRIYTVQMGSRVMRGLISPDELLELVVSLDKFVGQFGATVEYRGGGVYVARRGEVEVTLTVGSINPSIPGSNVFKSLEDMFTSITDV